MPGENAAQGVATTANPAPRSCLLIAGDSATLLQGRRCCNLLTPPQFPNLVRREIPLAYTWAVGRLMLATSTILPCLPCCSEL